MSGPLRVAVNAVALLSPFAGLANYVRNLMRALAATGAVQPRYFYGAGWSDELRSGSSPVFSKSRDLVRRWVPAAWELSRALQGFAFTREATPDRFDLYHEPGFLLLSDRLPAIVTVHDLSFVHYPETHPAGRVRVVTRRLPRSLETARAVLTDSEAVRQEVMRHYGVPAHKIEAIPLGASPRFRPQREDALRPVLERFGLRSGSYLLSVGTLEPRKNLVRMLRGYAALPDGLRARFPLAVVGAAGWHESAIYAEIAPFERRGEVRVLNYVDEEALAALYAGARGVVYASIYEGFGLPILEAMACGTPVVTSNTGCMKELAEGAALLVEPTDADAIGAGLRRLLEDEQEAKRLRAAGLERARQHTWERCAARTLAVYRRVTAS